MIDLKETVGGRRRRRAYEREVWRGGRVIDGLGEFGCERSRLSPRRWKPIWSREVGRSKSLCFFPATVEFSRRREGIYHDGAHFVRDNLKRSIYESLYFYSAFCVNIN